MLQFESTFGGGDSGETELTEHDVLDIDHIIEVDEEEMLISLLLCAYSGSRKINWSLRAFYPQYQPGNSLWQPRALLYRK